MPPDLYILAIRNEVVMLFQQTVFIVIFVVSVLSFVFSCYQRLQLIDIGAPENRFDSPWTRLFGMFIYAFAQKRVVKRPYGFNHFLLFWAFLVLLLANGEFLLEGLIPGATLAAVLPASPYHVLTALFDVVSLVALISVLFAFARRIFFPPAYLGNDYAKPASGEAL